LDYLESVWQEPDDGIWEARGPRRHYTQSKVMAWLVFDRAIALGRRFGLEGPLRRWEQVRAQIHDEILERAYDPQRRTFTQSYGSTALDAGALTVGLVGLLDPADDRFTTTIDAVRRELGHDGFISRYSTDVTDDGLSGSEGQFLACSFWLVEALALNGREAEARELFEQLLALRNDLGLYAEEYDVARRRQVGNFPQGIHPSRPDQRRQNPQRRADRDPIRAPRAAAAPAMPTPRRPAPGEAEATIATCPAASCRMRSRADRAAAVRGGSSGAALVAGDTAPLCLLTRRYPGWSTDAG
jgi:Glycosyl hydrolases family 15